MEEKRDESKSLRSERVTQIEALFRDCGQELCPIRHHFTGTDVEATKAIRDLLAWYKKVLAERQEREKPQPYRDVSGGLHGGVSEGQRIRREALEEAAKIAEQVAEDTALDTHIGKWIAKAIRDAQRESGSKS